MISNKKIVEKIQHFASLKGISKNSHITDLVKMPRAALNDLKRLKTAPRLDTIEKFAKALGVEIEDLIFDRTDSDRELGKQIKNLSEYEKTEVVVYIKMMLREKSQKLRKVA